MTEFLSSVKADLMDRRLLPIVATVAVALVAALAYAVLGGAGAAPAPVLGHALRVPAGITVTQAQANPDQPVAETTSGASHQRAGSSRNPFQALVAPARSSARVGTSASPTANASGGSATSSGSAGAGAGSAGAAPSTPSATTPVTPPTPAKPSPPVKSPAPAKPTSVYHVAVMFGPITPGLPPETALLTPYESLKLLTPLPSAQQPLLVFRGVTSGGKSATFTLVGEAILHGSAACLPSASQCQAIDLKPGTFEQLEYLAPSGTVAYELRVVSIVSNKASGASAKSQLRGESKPGLEVLRHAGLLAVPDLHYSAQVGVLAFAAHPGFAARARAAARRLHHGR
jgi:hypothetical protein